MHHMQEVIQLQLKREACWECGCDCGLQPSQEPLIQTTRVTVSVWLCEYFDFQTTREIQFYQSKNFLSFSYFLTPFKSLF